MEAWTGPGLGAPSVLWTFVPGGPPHAGERTSGTTPRRLRILGHRLFLRCSERFAAGSSPSPRENPTSRTVRKRKLPQTGVWSHTICRITLVSYSMRSIPTPTRPRELCRHPRGRARRTGDNCYGGIPLLIARAREMEFGLKAPADYPLADTLRCSSARFHRFFLQTT